MRSVPWQAESSIQNYGELKFYSNLLDVQELFHKKLKLVFFISCCYYSDDMKGSIALIGRGGCQFTEKARRSVIYTVIV